MPKQIIEVHFLPQLQEIIQQEMAETGVACDLNHLDMSEMQDLSDVFKDSPFQGDISRWRLDFVRDMRRMFAGSSFTGNLSNWDINPRIHLEGMFSPEFKGILPALRKLPPEERINVYTKMFNGDDAFSKYLSMQPFGQLHAAFLLDTNVQPIWLTSEEFSNVKNARNLGHGLGLKHDELCTLLQEQHCAPKTNLTLDSSDIDFSQ